LELIILKAQILGELTRTEEAMELIENSMILFPTDTDLKLVKGSLLSLLKQHEAAIDQFLQVLESIEDKDEVYFRIGLCYLNWPKPREAVDMFKKALEHNPENESALVELANALDEIGKIEESIPFYKQFIDIDPFSFTAWYNLGIAYSKLKQYEKAVDAYEYSLAIEPTFGSSLFNLGNTFMNLNEYAKAEEAYRLCLQHDDPNPELYCCLGASLERQRQFNEALTFYKESVKIDPLWDEGYYGLAVCLTELDKWFESLHFLKKAIKLNETNPLYWTGLADVEAYLGNTISADESYQKSLELDSFFAPTWVKWAQLHYDLEDFEKSADIMLSAIDELPEEAELYYRSAIFLIKAGQFKEAFHFLETGLVLDYDKHVLIFDYFPNLETQKAIFKLIQQYKK
jgi:tetratricopeptide (TPR) repeat protein